MKYEVVHVCFNQKAWNFPSVVQRPADGSGHGGQDGPQGDLPSAGPAPKGDAREGVCTRKYNALYGGSVAPLRDQACSQCSGRRMSAFRRASQGEDL